MQKILFLIHDLGEGGAEKVLVNLVNNMDKKKFKISIIALFGGGVNERFLSDDVDYKAIFPRPFRGNSHIMKLFTPKQLHKIFVKEKYDIEVAYLEGPSARIISGCQNHDTKLVSWIHIEHKDSTVATRSFRSPKEAVKCYNRFDTLVGVSKEVKRSFLAALPTKTPMKVLYNTNESEKIIQLSNESVDELVSADEKKLIAVGKLLKNKGFDRLVRITKRLIDEGCKVHLYILGIGPLKAELERYIEENHLCDSITLLGYQTNPYKYVAKCDLFVCSSLAEGFSTAATEALIVGTPVCTVEVSGMKEMLGENDEYGVVVENDDDALYRGIKSLICDPEKLAHYKAMAALRGRMFDTGTTVEAVQNLFEELSGAGCV